jgi:predicted PurR-regulated permease PerM
MLASHDDNGLGRFTLRVLIVLLLGGLAVVFWRLANIILLLFGAILIAVGLRAASSRLTRAIRIGNRASLAIVVGLCVMALSASLWFFGTVAAGQVDEVALQVPAGLRLLVERLDSYPYGHFALEQARGAGAGATGWAASMLASVAGSLAAGIGYAALTFVVAIYLAAQPDLYRRLCLRLLPRRLWPRTEALFDRTGDILTRWMLGQLVVMVTIGTLSGIGLWALRIEAPFALGLVGGLLTFIPYVGAVTAAVPATLVALTQGPVYAGSVVLMYIGVHFVEGNFITPLVQAEATSLPPVMALLSTVSLSILFGPSAVLLAAPLTLSLIVAVEVLYVEQALAGQAPNDVRAVAADRATGI